MYRLELDLYPFGRMLLSEVSMKWVVTILSVLMGAFYLFAGGTKLAGLPMHVEHFAHWGYPAWFMYVIGTMETASAAMLFVPKLRFFGAALIVCDMLGAVVTHVRADEMSRIPMPAILLALAVFLAVKSRRS